MKLWLCALGVLLVVGWPLVAYGQATGESPAGGEAAAAKRAMDPHDRAMIACYVALSVAFVTAVSILGAAYAVGRVGSAAIGAASEKPEMMARSLVFVALGEGLAVLGLAVAFLLMFVILMPLIGP